MSSRFSSRLAVLIYSALESVRALGRRRVPSQPQRILIAHHLLLGDTLMLAPLLAKLRQHYPHAEIVMTVQKSLAALFEKKPYGVLALSYDPHDIQTLKKLRKQKNFDLALVPGDNRYTLLARALGARWIIAFADDQPNWKNWFVDKLIPFPNKPTALGDIFATLIEGEPPQPYRKNDWPAPTAAAFDLPRTAYAILHVGARNRLRLWEAHKWRLIAKYLDYRGLQPVFTAAAHEADIVSQIDSQKEYHSYAGQLDLAQLWHLLSQANLIVTLDTGIAHLAKLTTTPTICLFGPGSAVLFGKGDFWRNNIFQSITIADFPCRDQQKLFKRELSWVRHCSRTENECSQARCMQALEVATVREQIDSLL